MDENDQIQEQNEADEQNPQENRSRENKLKDLKDTKGKLDKFSEIAKGGAKPPIPAGGAGATASGAAAAEAGAITGSTAGGAAAGTAAAGSATAAGGAAGATAASAPLWPWILIVGIALLILFLIIFFIIGLLSDGELSSSDSLVSISKSGPTQVDNGSSITYSISASYNGTADDVVIRDSIPENTEYVSTAPSAKTLDESGQETSDLTLIKNIEWSLKEIQNTSGKSTYTPQDLTLTIRPLTPDIYVLNQAEAEVIGGVGNPNITPGPSGIIPPNEDNCNGYYTNLINKNPLKKNFGDPNCTMLANSKPEDKDRLFSLFQQLDPTYADFWFFTIVPCESSYNPNNYANYYAELHDEYPNLDPDGVWGLLQMGSDLDGDGSGKNGPLDRGDVNWEKQVSNAIDYSRWITTQGGGQWAYWQCANGLNP